MVQSTNEAYWIISDKIRDKSLKIGVLGAGYVGLPLALLIVQKGFNVCCIDIDQSKLNCLESGKSYIADVTDKDVQDALSSERFTVSEPPESYENYDALIVALPTPSDEKTNLPDTSILKSALSNVLKTCKPNALLVVESTVQVNFTDSLVSSLQSSLHLDKDCFICFSPERVDPGNKQYDISDIPKIISGNGEFAVKLLKSFYGHFFNRLEIASSIAAAEFTKLFENVHRAVNIALVNEIADTSAKLGLNIEEILKLAATKPFGYTPYYPNAGVGGHCIPVDPAYYLDSLDDGPNTSPIVALSHESNIMRPEKFAKFCHELMEQKQMQSVLIVGYSYKPNVSDSRNSPGKNIVKYLKSTDKTISVFDSLMSVELQNHENVEFLNSLSETDDIYDLAIILCLHKDMDIQSIKSKSKIQLYGSSPIS